MTTVASGFCTSAPAEFDKAIGRKPSEATAAVSSTGPEPLLGGTQHPLAYLVHAGGGQLIEAGHQHNAVQYRHPKQRDKAHARPKC